MKRALISVSDKTGVVPFAQELIKLDFSIISTGGTAKILSGEGVEVTPIREVTGFPEIMDGRVKTLHPKIHGGLLALRDNKSHMEQADKREIRMIDMVVVNLYPFKSVIKKPDVSLEDAIENIDIGGPTMIRASAKNYRHVIVIVDPGDYNTVLDELKSHGDVSMKTRERLAIKVFEHTNSYDGAIHSFLSEKLLDQEN
jgi:phosphoribosylaminoimidazolecarboxamide formyltransferase/IMP cyclohydrolase